MSQSQRFYFYYLPEQKEKLFARWWRAGQAAKAWGCSRATVYRIAQKYPEKLQLTWIVVNTPKGWEEWQVMPAGTPRPETPPRGNPLFRDREWQRERARKREEKRRFTRP